MIQDMKKLRGYRQPSFVRGFVELAAQQIANRRIDLLELLAYRSLRNDQRERIKWVNGLPVAVFEGLSSLLLELAFEHRSYLSCPYLFAVRIERKSREQKTLDRWERRKAVRELTAATPQAQAKKMVVRL